MRKRPREKQKLGTDDVANVAKLSAILEKYLFFFCLNYVNFVLLITV